MSTAEERALARRSWPAKLTTLREQDEEDGALAPQAVWEAVLELSPGRPFERSDVIDFVRCLSAGRLAAQIDGQSVPFIGYDELIMSMTASGRPKDLVDAAALQQLKSERD